MKFKVPNPRIRMVVIEWKYPVVNGVVEVPQQFRKQMEAAGYECLAGPAAGWELTRKKPKVGITHRFQVVKGEKNEPDP
jgi:hypothetical protein